MSHRECGALPCSHASTPPLFRPLQVLGREEQGPRHQCEGMNVKGCRPARRYAPVAGTCWAPFCSIRKHSSPTMLQVSNRAKELVALLQNPDRIRCAGVGRWRAVPPDALYPTSQPAACSIPPRDAFRKASVLSSHPPLAPLSAERAKAKSLKDKFCGASREDIPAGAGWGTVPSSSRAGTDGASSWGGGSSAGGSPGLSHQSSVAHGDDGHLGKRGQALGGEARPGKVRQAMALLCGLGACSQCSRERRCVGMPRDAGIAACVGGALCDTRCTPGSSAHAGLWSAGH